MQINSFHTIISITNSENSLMVSFKIISRKICVLLEKKSKYFLHISVIIQIF